MSRNLPNQATNTSEISQYVSNLKFPISELFELYEKAEVRIATGLINNTSHLLFATVRLLPKDSDSSYSSKLVGIDINENRKIFFRKVIMSASDAINWYRTKNGTPLYTPRAETQFGEINSNAEYVVQEADFTDETIWGDFGIPLTEDNFLDGLSENLAPFLGYNAAKIHRRFAPQHDLIVIKENPKAISFLKQSLFIDLAEYPEYIGGMVLILPNPIVESIEDRLISSQDGKIEKEYRLLKINPYPSQNLNSLKLINFEIYLNILKNIRIINVPDDGVILLPNNNAFQSHGYFLMHETFGCLEFRPPTTYLRQMNFHSQIIGSTLNVKTFENSKLSSPLYEYEVPRIEIASETTIGTVQYNEIFQRVMEAKTNRKDKKSNLLYKQYWFEEGNREHALTEIGKLISQAREYVEFYDPYFGDLQITQFALKVQFQEIRIRIITSKLAFPEIEKAHNMLGQIEEVNNKNLGFAIDCVVLNQNEPVLHDRFLVIDKAIWFVGHSFNRIGEKSSFMSKVPHPVSIFPRLENIKQQTIPLEEYCKIYEKR